MTPQRGVMLFTIGQFTTYDFCFTHLISMSRSGVVEGSLRAADAERLLWKVSETCRHDETDYKGNFQRDDWHYAVISLFCTDKITD